MLEHALAYAARGWRVLPLYEIGPDGKCTCGKKCGSPGKHPRTKNGVKGASTNEAEITIWWQESPKANIGIATGPESDLLVLDVDTLEAHGVDGVKNWNILAEQNGRSTTHIVQTGSGGFQFYYKYPKGSKITIGASVLAKGVDHRGAEGYVVAPPSNHASGKHYEVIGTFPVAEAPQWVVDGLTRPKDVPEASEAPKRQPTPEELALARQKLAERCAAIESIPKSAGKGHETIVREAFTVGGLWPLSTKEREAALMAAAARRYPELSPDTLRQVRGCITKGAAHPIDLATEIETAGAFALPEQKAKTPAPEKGVIEWLDASALAAELPPTKWLVPDLQLCPGRPTMIAGYGFSGKTMSCQSLLLSYAAGAAVWDRFATTHTPKAVRHFDHEQGKHATIKRYQRLSIGHGLGLAKLPLSVACFPPINLTGNGMFSAYCRESEGVDLVLIDSLRAVTPGVDENDSTIRHYIDLLSAVSDKTGTCFVLIHHAGKGDGEHAGVRGSSAIFDGCGCVLELRADETGIKVSQTKGPAESDQGRIEPFGLQISDVQVDNNPKAGVRVTHVEAGPPADKYEVRVKAVVDYVRANPGAWVNKILDNVGGGKGMLCAILADLDGHQLVQKEHDGRTCWWPRESST